MSDINFAALVFRAERGLNYPRDNQILFEALKLATEDNEKLYACLSGGYHITQQKKQEAEHED
jgi:hypothetical protein